MKTICGVDIGKTGAVSIIRGEEIEMHVMPILAGELDLSSLTDIFHSANEGNVVVYVELVHAMPKNGSVSMFSFGKCFGSVLGIISALRMPFKLVRPHAWQKVMYEGVSGKAQGKDRSILAAKRLFPLLDLRANEKCRTPHLGKVDSLLIAEYGRRQK